MKKQIRNLAMLLLVTTAWTGCTDEIAVENTPTDTTKGTTLIASMGEDNPQTRIDFTENKANGVALKWSAGDEFTVYNKNSEEPVGNFILKSGAGSTQGVFEAVGNASLTDNTQYIAIYPAISSTSERYQNTRDYSTCGYIANGNNDMTLLNEMIHLEAEFTYNSGTEVGTLLTFEHQNAMLTIKLPANKISETPGKVSMHSSLNDFADVQFINADPTAEITAYTMMMPATGTRDLTFAVITATGKVYTQTISDITKDYEAGKRYTAMLDNLTEFTAGVDLASFASGTPAGDIWVITDEGSPTASQFTNLINKIRVIFGRKIELIFSAIEAVPANAMMSTNSAYALASISCPQATSLGNTVFSNNEGLRSVYLPNVINVSTAFQSTGLKSIYLPKLTTLPGTAFANCFDLTTVNLPKATTIGRYVFNNCPSLKSLTVATEADLTSLDANAFSGSLTGITVTTGSGTTTDNSWTAGGQTFGPFKKVNITGAP